MSGVFIQAYKPRLKQQICRLLSQWRLSHFRKYSSSRDSAQYLSSVGCPLRQRSVVSADPLAQVQEPEARRNPIRTLPVTL